MCFHLDVPVRDVTILSRHTTPSKHLTLYQKSCDRASGHARVDDGEGVGSWLACPWFDDAPLCPHVDPAIRKAWPYCFQILPGNVHVQIGDVLEACSGYFLLGEIEPVAGVAPRLVCETSARGVAVDPATTFACADECGSVACEACDVVVNAVNLVEDSIHIRVVVYRPRNIAL